MLRVHAVSATVQISLRGLLDRRRVLRGGRFVLFWQEIQDSVTPTHRGINSEGSKKLYTHTVRGENSSQALGHRWIRGAS